MVDISDEGTIYDMATSVVVLVGALVLVGLAVQQMRQDEENSKRVPVPVTVEGDGERRSRRR